MQDSSQGVIALLTHPVAGNPAQFVIERALSAWGVDTRYLSLEVSPDGLAAAIAGAWAMGFRGLHVDDPHREAVASLAATTTDSVARTQVANCLVRDTDGWRATNTLGAGVAAALTSIGPLTGKRVVLLGAGKLARSVAAALAAASIARLLVVNRTQERGEALSALMRDAYHVDCTYDRWEQPLAVPDDCDVLVNATSIASNDPHARVPLRVETLRRETTVVDATMHPATQLLRDARAQGCPTVDGLAIYVRHVAAALELWTGRQPDLAIMREALEEFLEL
jgi:shikimate dehydrogenase